MNGRPGGGEALLLAAAVVWGFAFVAQRAGMASFAPFAFTGLRFALGVLVLAPLVLGRRRPAWRNPDLPRDGLLAGAALFAAVSLQQAGLVRCEAGAAGLLTGLYVFFTPLLGLFAGRRAPRRTWAAAALAVAGLGLLALRAGGWPRFAPGEGLVLLGAVGWALHLRILDRGAARQDPLVLAVLQFAVCAVLAGLVSVAAEPWRAGAIAAGWVPLLYGGAISVGVGYTLQVAGQRRVRPDLAALLLGLEALFAALGGAWLLGERLGLVGWSGAVALLAAIALAQRRPRLPASA